MCKLHFAIVSTIRPILHEGEIYHVFNRTIGKTPVFDTNGSIERGLDTIDFYRYKQSIKYSYFKSHKRSSQLKYLMLQQNSDPLVLIYAYALMPNHFHFLLKQNKKDGITVFISKLENSLAKYHNKKVERDGALFQNNFKAKHIDSREMLLTIFRYIHLNPVVSTILSFDRLHFSHITSYASYMLPSLNRFITPLNLEELSDRKKIVDFHAQKLPPAGW